MIFIGPSTIESGSSIFALITIASSATWLAMMASKAFGLELRSALRGALAA
jgi:hypothetical protein